MRGRARAVLADVSRFTHSRKSASALATGLALVAVAACSSSRSSRPGAATSTHAGEPSLGSRTSAESTGWRVSYHATFTDSDPSAQTITLLSDGSRKFRVTFDPPGNEDFAVSDGVKEVDSIQGQLEYAPTIQLTFRVGTEDLVKVCPEAKRVGRATVLGRAADRYTCKPASPDESSEITIDSGSGILLAEKAETSTIAATEHRCERHHPRRLVCTPEGPPRPSGADARIAQQQVAGRPRRRL